jgi:hypothetical protein
VKAAIYAAVFVLTAMFIDQAVVTTIVLYMYGGNVGCDVETYQRDWVGLALGYLTVYLLVYYVPMTVVYKYAILRLTNQNTLWLFAGYPLSWTILTIAFIPIFPGTKFLLMPTCVDDETSVLIRLAGVFAGPLVLYLVRFPVIIFKRLA